MTYRNTYIAFNKFLFMCVCPLFSSSQSQLRTVSYCSSTSIKRSRKMPHKKHNQPPLNLRPRQQSLRAKNKSFAIKTQKIMLPRSLHTSPNLIMSLCTFQCFIYMCLWLMETNFVYKTLPCMFFAVYGTRAFLRRHPITTWLKNFETKLKALF